MKKILHSFIYAGNGLLIFLQTDRNGKVHFAATIAVVLLAYFLKLTTTDASILLVCCTIVISLEMLNHAIEKMCDAFTMQQHATIKIIKDVSAGAVLWASIISVVIAILIFYPYLKTLLL